MTHAHSSLETCLFLLSKSCTPLTVAENEMLKSFNVLSFFQCRKQTDIQLNETGTNSINHQEYLGASSSKKKKNLLATGVASWAGLEIHSVWKWDPQGKGWAGKQEVPSGQLLGMEVGEVPGPPGEGGTCRKLPKVWCNQCWSEKKGGWRCPIHVPTRPHGAKSRNLYYVGPKLFALVGRFQLSFPLWFGFVCSVGLVLSVWFWYMVLFLTIEVLICPG